MKSECFKYVYEYLRTNQAIFLNCISSAFTSIANKPTRSTENHAHNLTGSTTYTLANISILYIRTYNNSIRISTPKASCQTKTTKQAPEIAARQHRRRRRCRASAVAAFSPTLTLLLSSPRDGQEHKRQSKSTHTEVSVEETNLHVHEC